MFVRFVHNCTLASKEKVVEALRETHKDVTSSKAQALRILDDIAVKRKVSNKKQDGVYWEVKEAVRKELGLTDLLATSQPEEEKAPPAIEKVVSVRGEVASAETNGTSITSAVQGGEEQPTTTPDSKKVAAAKNDYLA